jgi:YfiH family protein
MIPPDPIRLLTPDWPCPANVHAVISTRLGGCSQGAFKSANLGSHVGDDPAAVTANREMLVRQTGVQPWPWLTQVHGTDLMELGAAATNCGQIADGAHSRAPGAVCAVLTADCLPVLLCDRQGTQVAAVHAGWRGLAAGILGRAVQCFDASGEDLLAYLGPAIGPEHFEVGLDVHQACEALFFRLGPRGDWKICFHPSPHKPRHFLADLYGLARLALNCAGVHQIFGGSFCTYTDAEQFYSFRRDGVTGRMVSAVWLANPSIR